MQDNYRKLFKQTTAEQPSDYLLNKILGRIEWESKFRTIRNRVVIFSSCLFVSLIAFVPVYKLVVADIVSSGFGVFLSLLFSDAQILMTNWQNYLISLLDTLPIIGLILLLTVFFIILELAKALSKNIKALLTLKLINS